MWKVACYGEQTFGLCHFRAIMTNTSFTPRAAAALGERIDESRALRSQNKNKQARNAATIAVVERVKHEGLLTLIIPLLRMVPTLPFQLRRATHWTL